MQIWRRMKEAELLQREREEATSRATAAARSAAMMRVRAGRARRRRMDVEAQNSGVASSDKPAPSSSQHPPDTLAVVPAGVARATVAVPQISLEQVPGWEGGVSGAQMPVSSLAVTGGGGQGALVRKKAPTEDEIGRAASVIHGVVAVRRQHLEWKRKAAQRKRCRQATQDAVAATIAAAAAALQFSEQAEIDVEDAKERSQLQIANDLESQITTKNQDAVVDTDLDTVAEAQAKLDGKKKDAKRSKRNRKKKRFGFF